MKKVWLMVIGLVSVLLVAGLVGCSPGESSFTGVPSDIKVNLTNQQEGIWISGTGKVSAVPDIATLRLGIQAQAVTVAEAQAQASTAMDKVLSSLKDNNIAEKDIQNTFTIE